MRSCRDHKLNQVLENLVKFKRDIPHAVPPEIAKASVGLAQWRSCARLAALTLRWRKLFGMPSWLEDWRKRDKHVYEFESNLRDQLAGSRLDLYRVFSAWICSQYETVVVEDLDLRKTHELEETGEKADDEWLKHYVRDACLSKLFACLKDKASSYVKVDPKYTTLECWSCHETNPVGRDLNYACVGASCDEEWDQDVNAARNILGRGGGPAGPCMWDKPALAPNHVTTYDDKSPSGAGLAGAA